MQIFINMNFNRTFLNCFVVVTLFKNKTIDEYPMKILRTEKLLLDRHGLRPQLYFEEEKNVCVN